MVDLMSWLNQMLKEFVLTNSTKMCPTLVIFATDFQRKRCYVHINMPNLRINSQKKRHIMNDTTKICPIPVIFATYSQGKYP